MPAFSIPPSLGPGSRLGHYEIIAPLRAGGMATLFLGKRVGPAGFARHVAIEVVHAHLASDPSFVEMFLDEARLAARIQHPNVVHTEELGEENGMFYLAMEYVHGCSLSQFLMRLIQQKRGLALDVAVHIAMKLADGLHAAHEVKDENGNALGVVHRDVSPQNVLLAYDGQVKLIDFGVAKAAGRTRETTGASLKGKIRYMAPEQAWGRPIDRRTDVYALGIVLWEALTHRRLFTADDDFAALESVRTPQIVGPSTWVPTVNPDLDHAVMTALAPDPDARFRTAQAFRRALGGACPKAVVVEPDDLGALLVSVMEADIERERRSAPPAVTKALQIKPADVVRRTDAMKAYTRELPAYVAPTEDKPTKAERLSDRSSDRASDRPSDRPSDAADAMDDESRVRLSEITPISRSHSRATTVIVLTMLGLLAIFGVSFGTYWYEHHQAAPPPTTTVAPVVQLPEPPPTTVAPVIAPPTSVTPPRGRGTTRRGRATTADPAPSDPAPDPGAGTEPGTGTGEPTPPPAVDFEAPTPAAAVAPPPTAALIPPTSATIPRARAPIAVPLRRFPQ